MLPLRPARLPLLAAALALAATAAAQDKKDDPFKMPPLDAKEWKKLDNGMRVWDVKEGTGKEVPKGAEVTVHYTGWTTDGKVFDSSRKRGRTISFPLDGVIQGWQEGVPGMKVGGTRRLEIPYKLAYGEQGKPPVIPPKATLIFEIEVQDVK